MSHLLPIKKLSQFTRNAGSGLLKVGCSQLPADSWLWTAGSLAAATAMSHLLPIKKPLRVHEAG